jgi:hypothetical protein
VTFAGVDPLLIGWATTHFGVRFALDTPADLADVVPLVQLQTIGGPSDDRFAGLIAATVSVDSFAADYEAASDLAWQVDAGLRTALPGTKTGSVVFGKVRTLTIPGRRPWNDVTVRRYGATYQIWLRTPVSA